MKLYKRVLKMHQFRNLGKKSPTGLLLNSGFEKHGELVILVGENNVGKSNILEALKAFNDTDIKLCNENDYFKAHESKDTILSLEEETSRNNETIDFSCVDLKIQTKEIGEGLKELSKTLIVYPFEKHVEALVEQCSKIVFIPSNNNDYSNICTFVSSFTNLIDSYNQLKPFLHFYKELIKYVSGNSEWIKTFCQCIKEIIKHNTPNKKCNSDDFFVMGKHKQNQLSKIYSRFKKLNGNEIKTKDVKYISKKIKSLDEKSGVHLFPKNIDEIKQKFEANKEKFQQSKNYSEFAEYCRKCNPYTAFQGLRNRVNFPLKNHSLDKFVPTMKEYKELKITDNDLKTALLTRLDYSSPSEFNQSDWFFQNSLFRKMDFHPNTIWNTFGKILNYKNFDQKDLKYEQALEIMFDKNNDLEVYSIYNKLFNISKKYLQKINQESLKEIKQSKYPFNIEAKGEYNNNVWQLEFFNDKSPLLFKINFTEILENIAEILEYNMQLKMDSLIAKEFNKLLAIAQDDHQDNYQLKIRVRHNNKFFREKYTAYEIKLEIHDCRKSDNQKPIILSQQSAGFQWAFNFMFGFLYNVGSNFSFNKNIIYVMDEPATHLSVPARKEFRKFLKEYAHKHNTTFVLATHDPFLVDTDHLDEIRIVEKETEGSAIENTFNYSLKNDANRNSDALDKIKRSLEVGQHVFHNPQKHRIIFVEGTTDYCYLSAFKLYFNEREFKNDPIPFTFLPISGLKDNQKDMQKTIQKLHELDNNPIVLIDDDRKDGSDPQKAKSERFKKANKEMKEPIKILQLSSCDENFKQIEHCFSANDREEYAKNKCMELAMAFKARLLYSEKDDVMSEETKKNFLKLFEWIAKECNDSKNRLKNNA
ncbi:AAA family ATPase [Helicobacter pylori]|uniref:AAA family ATPase n=1 Tax=Helicobacter pylori TaxID=210 RepID=UPI00112ECCBC|nr:OLD family endonuclease [Helicobacter pylori]TPH30462.1 OLD family endonuclease [Helicobacter pylori]